ncbi:hypothetical protein ACWENR_01050 [Micromonospora sp. NPDC004336]
MAVRRHVARLATVCALLGGLVALGATPALAADDSVRVRSAGSFTAGGSAEGVSIEVRKRSDGCVLLRTALGLRLGGLRADQVRAQVNVGGRWFPVSLSGGGGSVATPATAPANPRLCKGKSATVRYRVAFVAGAPDGRLTVAGEATSALGRLLGRAAEASRVVGGRASASPTPTPSKKPSPTPSAVATVPASVDAGVTAAALSGQGAGATVDAAAEESGGGGSVIMFFGIAMVAVGILLIVLLFRRSRADKEPADDLSRVPLPRNPGGTTYRSARGPAAAPTPPGQVYGQQPAPGVYGTTSAPRPTGGVYGSRPGGDAPAPPPASAPPGAPMSAPPAPGQYGRPTSAPPASGPPAWGPPASAPPASGPPASAPPASGPPASGRPGDPPPEAGGGDHTVFMPRLPG